MSLFLPAYKLTVYAPTSVDPTELTALTPVAGAIHSDPFSVTTLPTLGGFKPYLGLPQGRKATYDPTTGKVSNQDLTFRLLDMKSGNSGGNVQRWVTAFVGDNSGSLNLMNRRVAVWESLDGGATWSAFYEGRISSTNLDDPLWYSISIKSRIEDLNVEAFKHRPASNVSGYAQTSLIPMGLSANYGPFSASAGLKANFTVSGTTGSLSCDVSNYQNGLSTVLVGYLQRGIKTLSAAQEFVARVFGDDTTQGTGIESSANAGESKFRLQITSGSTVGEYFVSDLTFELHTAAEKNKNEVYRVKTIKCFEIPTTDPLYKTIGTFSGKPVTCRIIPNKELIADTNPLFISGKHPGAFIRELASGSYGYVTGSNRTPVRQVISYDSASFAAFESASFYQTPRFKITKSTKINDFIEKYLSPLGLGYRVDPILSGSTVISQLSVFDSRIPPSSSFAGLPALTDADIATVDFNWSIGTPVSNISVKHYVEYQQPLDNKTIASNEVYDIDPWLISEADTTDIELITPNIASTAKTVTLDALGSRSPRFFLYARAIQDVSHLDLLNYQYDRFAFGPPSISLKCRRTTTVNGLKLGQWVLVNVSLLPDPTGHQRGGVRLCQVTEKSEDGLFINLSLADAGKNVLNLAPSIGSITSANSPAGLAANVPVTAISGQKLLIQMAEVASGSAVPVELSPLWSSVVRANVNTSSAVTYVVTGLKANQTYWFRARTSTLDDSLPSVWAYSVAGFTTSPLTAPTSVTVSNITATGARISWNNNGDNASDVLITYASPSSSAVLNTVATLYPGSTLIDLANLSNASADNPYLVGVTHVNAGAASTTATVAFSLSASAATCPAMTGLKVYTAAFSTDHDSANSTGQPYSLTGVPLLLTPSSLDYDVEVQRAPDVAGAPGTYASLDIIPRQELSLGGYLYKDFLPLNGAINWYRTRHVRTGFNSGSFFTAITGSAGKLKADVEGPTNADLPPGIIADYTPFASTIRPPIIVSVLPATATEGDTAFLTTDGKLYRYHSGAWTAAVPTVDLVGQVSGSQIVDGAITTTKLGASAVVSASIAVGAITAPHIAALIGGGNQFFDSGFERNDNTYWGLYNNGPESATLTFPTTTPYRGTRSAKINWTSTNTSTKGIYAAVNPAWKPNTTYVLSWYAKVTTAWSQGMNLAWNTAPSVTTAILNPNLSTTYQRYAYRITWGASVDTSAYFTVSGAATANDLFIDCIQAEEGEVLTAYAPKPDEILPSTITVTEIADNAVTTPKLIAGAVTAGKIAAHTITANEIAADTITASEIAANAITATEIAANAVTAVKIQAGAVTAEKLTVGSLNDSVLLNSSFEEVSTADATMAAQWMRSIAFGGTGVALTTADHLSGDRAMDITPGTGVSGDVGPSSGVPVVPGEAWYISANIKGHGSGVSAMYLRFRGGTTATDLSSEWGYNVENINVPTAWTKYENVAVVPAGVYWARPFVLNYQANTGKGIYIDDVSMRKVVVSAQIADGGITTAKLAAGAVTAATIAANTITAGQIAANTITAAQIAGNTITAGQIAANTITAGQIATDTITAGQIAAGAIGASEIAAGAITAGKIAIGTGGAALNSDPNCTDIGAWVLIGGSAGITAVSDGKVGGTVIQPTTGNICEVVSQAQPYDPTKSYRVRLWARNVASANGALYAGIGIRDHSGALVGPGPNFIYIAASGVAGSTSWTEYVGVLPANYGSFVGTPETMQVVVLLNYAGTTGYMQAQDIRIEEVIPGSLIVDGTITASKIAAGAIDASKISAHSITTNEITVNSLVDVCFLTDSVNNTIATNTPISYDWNNEITDSANLHTAGFLAAIVLGHTGGVVFITVKVTWQIVVPGGGFCSLKIQKNGSSYLDTIIQPASTFSVSGDQMLSTIDYNPTSGDYYRVEVTQNTGNNQHVIMNTFKVGHLKL